MDSEKDFGIKKIGSLTDEEIFGAKTKEQLLNLNASLTEGLKNPHLDFNKDNFSKQLNLIKDEKFQDYLNKTIFNFMKGKIKFRESLEDFKWSILFLLGGLGVTIAMPPFAVFAVFILILSLVKGISSFFKIISSILSYTEASNKAKEIGVDVNSVNWYVIFILMVFINAICALVAVPILSENFKNKINTHLSQIGIKEVDFDGLMDIYKDLRTKEKKEKSLLMLKDLIAKKDF